MPNAMSRKNAVEGHPYKPKKHMLTRADNDRARNYYRSIAAISPLRVVEKLNK